MKAGGIGTLCLTVFLVTAATPARAETKGERLSPSEVQIVGHVSFGERALADMAAHDRRR